MNKLFKISLAWKRLLFFTALTLVPMSSSAQKVLSPERIHKAIAPSVALIKDIESHGSGVIISKNGLLITNYHVVASGLPLDVTVKVKKGRVIKNKTFKNLKVWKVHPKYDLALIQLPSKGVKFAVADLLTSQKTLNSGATCYAIGNPAGTNAALDQSITNGLVSSASREIDGLKYIQVSCALNPGNSGGAICNNKGTVIGIATWKLGQAENIGFAIPTSEIKLKDFIDIKDRKTDFELGSKYEQEGHRILKISRTLRGKDKKLAIMIAATYYRKSLEHLPNSPSPYHNIGLMYFQLEKDKIARKYLEKAIGMKTLFAPSAAILGEILDRTYKDEKAALDLMFKHSKDPDFPVEASRCMENISIYYYNKQQFATAAYSVQWANAIHNPQPHLKNTREQIWQDASEKLTNAQYDSLKSKTGDFSRAEMKAFSKGVLAKSTGKKGSAKPNTPKTTRGILRINKSAYITAAKKKTSKAPEISVDGLEVPIPAIPGKMIMGYAGAYLLIEFPELKRLGVFDICAGRMSKYISLPEENSQFAAGGDILAIYLPESKKFQLWDMKTWTLKSEKVFRSTRTIHSLSMGLLNHNFILVNLSTRNHRARNSLGILSLPECKLLIPKWTSPSGKSDQGADSINTFFSHNGSRAKLDVEETGRYATVNSPSFSLIDFSNELKPELDHYFTSPASTFILGGNYLLSNNFAVYSKHNINNRKNLLRERLTKHNPEKIPSGHRVIKISGFKGIAHIAKRLGKEGELLVRDSKTLSVVSITALPRNIYNSYSGHSSSHSVFASAYVQRCLFIDHDKKRITIFPLTLDSKVIAKAKEIPKPGTTITRVINIPKGSTVSIEGDLKGASFSNKTNTLTWKIPANFKRGTKESIILLVTDPDGKTDYHVEQIYVP